MAGVGVPAGALPVPGEWRRGWPPARGRHTGVAESVDLPVGSGTQRGTLLPMRPTPYWQVVVFALVAAVFVVLAGLSVVIAALGRPQALVGLLVFLPVGLGFGAGAYWAVRFRRRVRPGIGLTPTHLVLANYADPVAVPWAAVGRIGSSSFRWGAGPGPDPVTNVVTVIGTDSTLLATLSGPVRRLGERSLRRTGETSLATVATSAWSLDPVVAYHAMRFYLAHPELRAELAGDAAPRRIADRALL